MEDGHTLFDYDVRLNDTIQLLVRQSLVLPPSGGGGGGSKERDSELSDTDSGCCLGQSESDKSSNSGEAAVETDGKTAEGDEDAWDDTELGLYKVRPGPRGRLEGGRSPRPTAPCLPWPPLQLCPCGGHRSPAVPSSGSSWGRIAAAPAPCPWGSPGLPASPLGLRSAVAVELLASLAKIHIAILKKWAVPVSLGSTAGWSCPQGTTGTSGVVRTGGAAGVSGRGRGSCSAPPVPRTARQRTAGPQRPTAPPREARCRPWARVPGVGTRTGSGPWPVPRVGPPSLARAGWERSLSSQVNEYVDARDTNMGAWFEAQVVKVTRRAPAQDEPCSSTSCSAPEGDVIYHVTYDE